MVYKKKRIPFFPRNKKGDILKNHEAALFHTKKLCSEHVKHHYSIVKTDRYELCDILRYSEAKQQLC